MKQARTSLFFLGLCACVWALTLGPDTQDSLSGPTIVLSLVAGAFGIRRSAGPHRLWWMMFSALALFTVGVVLREIDSARSGIEFPFPSIADVPVIIGFGLLSASLFVIVRSRSRRGELAQYADMIIVCVAAASLYWVFLSLIHI